MHLSSLEFVTNAGVSLHFKNEEDWVIGIYMNGGYEGCYVWPKNQRPTWKTPEARFDAFVYDLVEACEKLTEIVEGEAGYLKDTLINCLEYIA